jgi:hypothetical protein
MQSIIGHFCRDVRKTKNEEKTIKFNPHFKKVIYFANIPFVKERTKMILSFNFSFTVKTQSLHEIENTSRLKMLLFYEHATYPYGL